jgi:hypothetical protein
MEYTFVHTFHGPVLQKNEEIIFFNEYDRLFTYYENDNYFLKKAKTFLSENFLRISKDLSTSIFEAKENGNQSQTVFTYLNAMRELSQFEYTYIPLKKGLSLPNAVF